MPGQPQQTLGCNLYANPSSLLFTYPSLLLRCAVLGVACTCAVYTHSVLATAALNPVTFVSFGTTVHQEGQAK